MLFYPAALPLSRQTLDYTAGVIRRHRRQIGSPWRKLNPGRQIIGLELADMAVDGCMTKAPCGGQRAGPSPVDRRKGGLKRSVATDGYGIPLGSPPRVLTGTTHRCWPPTLDAATGQLGGALPPDRTCHLDAGYDGRPTRQLLAQLGFAGQIAASGVPALSRPAAAGRWNAPTPGSTTTANSAG
jgi:hypothetical protein